MRKGALIVLLLTCLLPTHANHIVGGEIEFIYITDGLYRINLIQYFDEAQIENPGPEGAITVYIFRNSDGAVMSTHDLFFLSQEEVQYSNIECAIDELQTSRVVWTRDVFLDPADYTDEEGYYIVWERCCRNLNIKNIVNPLGTGMKYVLEIPPLMIGGQVFRNSSPILFRPLSDYACINQLYYVEFTGVDPDGDSLAYSLTTPYNSSSAVAVPTPSPKPHIDVLFSSGYSETNMIPGSPPLRISNKGLLTVTPSQTGLFVFSVLVDEFRNGIKIGQTRRDFQMLVVDGCEPPDPPVVDVSIPGNPGFDPANDTLSYTVSDAKCFDFLVSNVTNGETITLKAEGVNFDEDLDEIFILNQVPVGPGESQLQVEVCIPDCPPLFDEPFILDLIAGDDACPLPQLDTVRLTIEVQPPPNSFPVASTPSSIRVNEGGPIYSQQVIGTDADGENLSIRLVARGVEDIGQFGFSLNVTDSFPGSIEADIIWDPDCDLYDFSELQQFDLGILVEDADTCAAPNPDTLFIDAQVQLPPNTDPFVTTSISVPDAIDLGNELAFDVTVTDSDNDEVSLQLVGANFDPSFYGINFPSITGNTSATSSFFWDLSCNGSLFEDGQEFELLFIGDDDDKCKVKNFDTLSHTVQVNYPFNQAPGFAPTDQFLTINVNEPVRIPIDAFDLDNDQISLSFADGFRQPASQTLSFEEVIGTGQVQSFLEWQPECALLRLGETRSLQDVVLQVVDDACPVSNIDTLKITFEIINDTERQQDFLPPNVFTPNGDGLNDFFTLSGNQDVNQNLPPDNCENIFQYIVINNRAGNTVFRSTSRDFVWSGGQFPAGVYYYLIKYSTTDFKGYIHLMR